MGRRLPKGNLASRHTELNFETNVGMKKDPSTKEVMDFVEKKAWRSEKTTEYGGERMNLDSGNVF